MAGGVLRDASGIATYLAEAGLKIPGRRRYYVTLRGRRLLAAAIHYRTREFPNALAA